MKQVLVSKTSSIVLIVSQNSLTCKGNDPNFYHVFVLSFVSLCLLYEKLELLELYLKVKLTHRLFLIVG